MQFDSERGCGGSEMQSVQRETKSREETLVVCFCSERAKSEKEEKIRVHARVNQYSLDLRG